MDLAFGLLFHRFKTTFDRKMAVYCRDRNKPTKGKMAKCETRFPQEAHGPAMERRHSPLKNFSGGPN